MIDIQDVIMLRNIFVFKGMDCGCKARRWMETKLSKYMTNKV